MNKFFAVLMLVLISSQVAFAADAPYVAILPPEQESLGNNQFRQRGSYKCGYPHTVLNFKLAETSD